MMRSGNFSEYTGLSWVTVFWPAGSSQPVHKNRHRILSKQILAGRIFLSAFSTISPIQGFPIKDLDFYANLLPMSIERR
jgi:hypothetical protein